ncbi:hypothetical protein CPB85DRAFT_1430035 [Mucidula mucida]|nr:hypothetical protein CPB85DRAFT_1430035 [Mucidula mucida]
MPPLAGRPPYATNEPDSFYETPQPQRRMRQPTAPNPNDRTSAYNVYDNYVGNDAQPNRQSGMGALGEGFLNGSMDDDDDDDDDLRQPPLSTESRQAGPLPSKHAALAAATSRRGSPSPPPQYIASPRPGYAAPIAALNLARPEPAQAPNSRQPPLQINVNPNPPQGHNPFLLPSESFAPPSVPSTPHPLQAPMTPITPVFARPQKAEITFADEKPIMRGDREETLLPKRGERGDDFWRRFSVIAHDDEQRKSGSSWLRKTQNGSTRLSRWVWVTGMLLTICAAGGIGLGWYISHNDDSHNSPTALGGSEANAADESPSAAGTGTATVQSSLHVSPTLTVDRRAYEPFEAQETVILPVKRNHSHRRRNFENIY